MKKLLTSFARNTVFANIILVLIFLAGGLAAGSLIRENFPAFSLDMITVSVAYPGADPEEVEEGICQKIEEAVEGVEGIKQYTTRSSENVGTANIEVKENYNAQDVLEKVRTKINAVSTFPTDAEKPVISEVTFKDPVMMLYLSGDMSQRRIKEWAERLKDDIQQLNEISQVKIFGARDYEIGIEVSEERLREYGLTLRDVSDAVRRSSLNLAGGTIRSSGEEIRIRTIGRKYTGKELASVVVLARPKGEIITLDRIADIRDGFTEDPITAIVNGKPSVMLIVYKTQEEDALVISKAVQTFISAKQEQLPPGADLQILYDNTGMLQSRIDLLTKNGMLGLLIVFLSLWMFLNARLSFWAGMGIPVAVAGALGIMWALGATLNMISLFGLIMVMGVIVDDAIVVGESIYVHRKAGKPPLRAAVDGLCEVGMPVITAVITTVVAFIPIFFVGGIVGKFISILPTVVIACLLVSLVECLVLLPAHLSHLPDPNAQTGRPDSLFRRLANIHQVTAAGLEWFVRNAYAPFLRQAIRWRYVSCCIALSVLLLTIGLLRGGILKFEVFPEVDGFIVTSTVEFPAGTPVQETRQAIEKLDKALLRIADKTETRSGDPLIEHRLALVGQTLSDPPRTGPNLGSVQAILLGSEKRGIHTKDIMVAWEKEIGSLPGVQSLTFSGMQHGPPGDPIEIWLQGRSMEDILAASDTLMSRLETFDGVYQVHSDFTPGKNEMRLALKPEASTLGLTVEDLARQVYAGYFGSEAVRLQRGKDDIRVKVRYTADERKQISDVQRIRIRTAAGHQVPLLSVADVSFGPGYSTITRTDGMRRIAVSAGVDTKKANANEIFAELTADFFPELEKKFPGLSIALQGEQKKMRESFGTLKIGFPLAILGIFIIIATMFRSYAQTLVIMITVPFGIVGAAIGHLLLGYDLSMMSVFGMVALSGVVVNDAIVLIERINENIAEGMPFLDAIVKGGERRFRAIFLTSLSTVGGLAPLIMETDLQARFLIPMAISIAAGVTFSTALTLLMVPNLLVILNDLRLLFHRIRHGRWPDRLEVEPAKNRYTDEEAGPSRYTHPPVPLDMLN